MSKKQNDKDIRVLEYLVKLTEMHYNTVKNLHLLDNSHEIAAYDANELMKDIKNKLLVDAWVFFN